MLLGSQLGGVRIGLLLVRRAVRGEQVLRVVRQLAALLGGQILRAGLPCVRQCNHVVNLHRRGGLLAALELDGLAGVRVIQSAGNDGACVGPDLETNIGQVAAQNIVAGVALVAVNVIPGGAELVAGVTVLQRRVSFTCRDASSLFAVARSGASAVAGSTAL